MNSKTKNSNNWQEPACFPIVQLIGAQKAGTSAIADWLFDHGNFSRPKVFGNEPHYFSKEVHYFDVEDRYEQGPNFYSKRFHECNNTKATLDATPDTLPFAQRVRDTYDAAKLVDTLKIIVILREPISRELSLYNHLAFDCRNLSAKERTPWHSQVINKQGTIMSFDDFVLNKSIPALARETGPGRSTRHGLYAKHLSKWFELFDRRQILVLSYDELKKQPKQLQKRLQTFLGQEISGDIKCSNSNDSSHKVQLPSSATSKALSRVFTPLNKELYKLLESNPGLPMEQNPFPPFEEYSL